MGIISGGGKYFIEKFKLGKIEDQILAGDKKAGLGPQKPGGEDEVVVKGDKSKVSKKTTGMTNEEKRAEMKRRTEFKRKVAAAKGEEKKKERENLKQVQKDKRSNEKVQYKRKLEGKDYVKYKSGTDKDGGAKESVVVRKKLKDKKGPAKTDPNKEKLQKEIKKTIIPAASKTTKKQKKQLKKEWTKTKRKVKRDYPKEKF